MNQPSGSQAASGSQPRPPKCYNCGADHYLMSCPEPVRDVPAGLAAAHAARAAGAAHSADPADNSQSGHEPRPFKRQKTAAIVTKYPPGPVVSRYAAPAGQAAQTQSYYGPPSVQPYQFPAPNQPHPQHVPMQQNNVYSPYGGQPSSNIPPHGYAQPMALSLQGYSQTNPNLSGPYMQPLSHGSPRQFGYQNASGRNYYEGPMQQSYGYNSSVQYGPQQIIGQPPQSYPNYQGMPSFHGQPPQQYLPYTSPSPVQVSHGQTIPPQAQAWEQPYQGHHNVYGGPAYQSHHTQFGQRYQDHHNTVPQRQPQYQAPQFGNPNTSIQGPASSPGIVVPQHGFGANSMSPQDPIPPNVRRSSSSLNFNEDREAAAPRASEAEKSAVDTGKSSDHLEKTANEQETSTETLEMSGDGTGKTSEELEFEWELEHIFIEPKQHVADPIGYPLPVIYHEEPILPPAYDAEGIICKYVRPTNREVFTRDIRLSLHWPSLKFDPVFRDIDFNAPPMQLEGFGAWLQERVGPSRSAVLTESKSDHQTSHRVFSDEQDGIKEQAMNEAPFDSEALKNEERHHMSPPAIKNDRARTPMLDMLTGSGIARSSTPSFRVDDDAWAPQPGEGQFTTSPTEDPTETLLASLGVTGLPKPVQSNLSSFHLSGHRDKSLPETLSRHPMRHDSGYASQRNSYSNGHASAVDNSATFSDHRQDYSGSNPPPPPPPLHMRRHVDRTFGSPSSDGSARCHNGSATSPNENGNQVANQASSPITPTTAETGTHEGTPFKERKNGTKAPHLRQEDDVTPKLKRRQPKVADAYSRRW